MITQYPESPMPEPYKTYVRQRSQNVANVLQDVVGDTNVQLLPTAVTEANIIVDRNNGDLVYGCIVENPNDAYKSAFFNGNEFAAGVVAFDVDSAMRYASQQLRAGNTVRIKDPRQSDGDGQIAATTIEDVADFVANYDDLAKTGLVLMPDMLILDRFSAGVIDLGQHGEYRYYGREHVTPHEGREVFGGGDLAVARTLDHDRLHTAAEQKLYIPPEVRVLADAAIGFYRKQVKHAGRVSVDVLEGITNNGRKLTTVVDVTPRVGGHTPTEALAIRALNQTKADVAHASGRLLYNPAETPKTGTNFVDTPSLVINAAVTGVE